MFIWIKIALFRIIFLAGLLAVVATVSACGNRGSLYLQPDDSQAQAGHDVTPGATSTPAKVDKKERITGKEDQ